MKSFPRMRRCSPRPVGVHVALVVNVIAITCGIGFLLVDFQQEFQRRLADKSVSLDEQAMTLHQAISAVRGRPVEDQQTFIDAVCGRMSDDDSPGHHIVVEFEGQALQSRAHHRNSDELLEAIRAASIHPVRNNVHSDLLVGQHREAGITVYVAEQMTNIRREIRRQSSIRSVSIMSFGLLLTISVNVVIHRHVRKPLKRLVKTIDSIASGDYCGTKGSFDGAELAQIAAAVDSMSQTLACAEKQRRSSLDRARRVQEHLLPQSGGGNGLDVAFFHNAAEDVAGDFVDVFQTHRGTSIICVADVVGHGIAPAMIAAMLKVLLLDAAEAHDDPGEMMDLVNRRFTAVSLPEDFATIFLGVWSPQNRTLRYVSAGHEPALVVANDSTTSLLRSTGPMIGLDIAMSWRTQIVQIHNGALLAGWTDGITEAMGVTDEQFGKERLIALVRQHADRGPKRVVDEVERAVRGYARNRKLADDWTFFGVRFV